MNTALLAELKAAQLLTASSAKLLAADYRNPRAEEIRENCIAQVGQVTVKATHGGNTKAPHVRHTYRINGKRAALAEVIRHLESQPD